MYFLLLCLSVWIGITDCCYRRISNRQILCLSVVCLMIGLQQHLLLDTYVQALLVLGVGLVLFIFNIIGAGDVKLLSAYALIIHPSYFGAVLCLSAVLGGLLATFILLYDLIRSTQLKRKGLPYAIPIIVANLSGIYLTNML